MPIAPHALAAADGDAAEPAPGWRSLMERCWGDAPEDRPAFPVIVKELRQMVAALRPLSSSSRTGTGTGTTSSSSKISAAASLPVSPSANPPLA